jgi:hypothetical protein
VVRIHIDWQPPGTDLVEDALPQRVVVALLAVAEQRVELLLPDRRAHVREEDAPVEHPLVVHRERGVDRRVEEGDSGCHLLLDVAARAVGAFAERRHQQLALVGEVVRDDPRRPSACPGDRAQRDVRQPARGDLGAGGRDQLGSALVPVDHPRHRVQSLALWTVASQRL